MKKQCFFGRIPHTCNLAAAGIMAFFAFWGITLIGCSKDPGEKKQVIDTTPPPSTAPSGVIKEFYIDDTLIGYDRGTFVRWYVTETNNYTTVKLNDVKVAFSGSVTTGPLKSDVAYTLTVNNGLAQTKKIKVADETSTVLWNSGKRWQPADIWVYKQVKATGSLGQDTLVYDWVSVFNGNYQYYQDIRLSFFLTGIAKEESAASSWAAVTNKYVPELPVVPGTKRTFNWKNTLFTIDSASANMLTLRYDTTDMSGAKGKKQVKYVAVD